jgi:sporulation protein YlmC with PRC-barrel domain
MLHKAQEFSGFSIEATDGKIGVVSDFLFDDTNWKLRWLVIESGSWLDDRRVLVHPSSITSVDIACRTVLLNLTRDQVEKSPGLDKDAPVSQQYEYNLYGYYGMSPLWTGGYYGGGSAAIPFEALPVTAAGDAGAAHHGDVHLRSLSEVIGYHIMATDGKIGHVENLLIDDASWDVRYLVADTRNWWFGKHVLLAPSSVLKISWQQQEVCLNLTGYKIKGSPPWNATSLLDRAYEQMLHAYYEWPARFLPSQHEEKAAAVEPASRVKEDAAD